MSIRVLIADDDAGMRLVLKKAVERSGGFIVAGEAEDGGAALRLLNLCARKWCFSMSKCRSCLASNVQKDRGHRPQGCHYFCDGT